MTAPDLKMLKGGRTARHYGGEREGGACPQVRGEGARGKGKRKSSQGDVCLLHLIIRNGGDERKKGLKADSGRQRLGGGRGKKTIDCSLYSKTILHSKGQIQPLNWGGVC